MPKVLEQAPDGEADEEERGIEPATGKLETMYSLNSLNSLKLKTQKKGKFNIYCGSNATLCFLTRSDRSSYQDGSSCGRDNEGQEGEVHLQSTSSENIEGTKRGTASLFSSRCMANVMSVDCRYSRS